MALILFPQETKLDNAGGVKTGMKGRGGNGLNPSPFFSPSSTLAPLKFNSKKDHGFF